MPSELPYLTSTPGTGGTIRAQPEDFLVREVPAYLPAQSGSHVMVHIRKRNTTTITAATLLSKRLSVSIRDIGWAGMKDRYAVTEQWLSLPPPVTLDAIAQLASSELIDERGGTVELLAWAAHPHKLRLGHVARNEFVIRVRNPTLGNAAAQAAATLTALQPCSLNWYGEQRFGTHGDNAERGRELLASPPQQRGAFAKRVNRLLISALQSQLFNRWLAQRLGDGLLQTALLGDVLRKPGGGYFVCTDPATDTERIAAGEIVVAGPMFGVEMRAAQGVALEREQALLTAHGLTLESFAPVRNLATGTRREATIALHQPGIAVQEEGGATEDDDFVVAFGLPSGSYATAVLREITKSAPANDGSDLDFNESVEQ